MHAVTEAVSVVFSRSGLSEILIGSTLKGALILLVCLAIFHAWRRGTAAARHVLLSVGLASSLLILLVTAAWIVVDASSLQAVRVLRLAQSIAAQSVTGAAAPQVSFSLPGWWGIALAVWAGGVVFFSLRALAGMIRMRVLLRRALPIDDTGLQKLFGGCLETTGISRPVRLLMHPASRIPFTCGLIRPTVVLTRSAMDLTRDELRCVLLHELAHVKRIDVATNMIAQTALALFWFNPLVWIAVRQMYHEQERACDDFVLAAGEPAAEYAELLLSFGRTLRKRVALMSAGITFVRAGSLGHRIQSLFSPGLRRRSAGRATLATLVIAAVALVGLLSCVRTPTTEKAPTSEANDATTASDEYTVPKEVKPGDLPSPEDFVAVDEMPALTHSVSPEYPAAMSEQGLSGVVWIQALVDKAGQVTEARVLKKSDHQEFDEAALAAAYKQEFEPAKLNGVPVAVWVSYKVEFKWAGK